MTTRNDDQDDHDNPEDAGECSDLFRHVDRPYRVTSLGDIAALPRYFDRPGMAERRRAYHDRVVASRQERLA